MRALIVFAAVLTVAQAMQASAVNVLVSTQSLSGIVKAVGGEYVDVRVLVPPGVDPHSYEPNPVDVSSALDWADVVVVGGPSHTRVEEMLDYLRGSGYTKALFIGYEDYVEMGLHLLEYRGSPNPHGYVWGAKSMGAVARAVAEALSTVDPGHASYYLSRAEFISEAAGLHVSSLSGLKVAVYSLVDYYMAAEAGAEVVLVVVQEPGAEPDPGSIRALLDYAGSLDALIVSELDLRLSRNAWQVIARFNEAGGRVALVPLGDTSYDPLSALSASVWAVRSPITGDGYESGCVGSPIMLVAAGIVGASIGFMVALAWARRAS